jgi:hypothetical protein
MLVQMGLRMSPSSLLGSMEKIILYVITAVRANISYSDLEQASLDWGELLTFEC